MARSQHGSVPGSCTPPISSARKVSSAAAAPCSMWSNRTMRLPMSPAVRTTRATPRPPRQSNHRGNTMQPFRRPRTASRLLQPAVRSAPLRSRPSWLGVAMALLLPVTAATQDGDREPLAGVPGILSLPTTHPWGLNQMVVKHAGFTTAPPAPAFGNTGTPDFSESALLGGASGLDIDGFSVGLDWILADANGQVPPPGSVAAPWSWAGFIFSP